jgi:Fe2+ transport system protein FeoA
MLNINVLPIGARAIVTGLNIDTQDISTPLSPACQRLLELGFTPGATLQLLHRSPLGDAFAVAIEGNSILLGLTEALLLSLSNDLP